MIKNCAVWVWITPNLLRCRPIPRSKIIYYRPTQKIWRACQRSFYNVNFNLGDAFIFGPETRGLPATILSELGNNILRIPMQAQSRSLNLSNTASLVVYEAWRQIGFPGAQ